MEIVAVGNALMDVIAFVDEDFAPSLGYHNNSTSHLEPQTLRGVLSRLENPVFAAGGGAANTARAAAVLGLRASYYGAVGDDALGELYAEELRGAGVGGALVRIAEKPTGIFAALARPDGGRTILVAPGAALGLALSPPPLEAFAPGKLLYIEGFLLRDEAWFRACLEGARAAGMRIAIDLGSQSLVRRNRDFLLGLLPDFCDYLFANEDEFLALADLPLEEGLDLLGEEGMALVVKRAERGALYRRGEEWHESPVRALRPLDETGAGDAFAAGFLAGLAEGLPPERCLRLGNRIAEEVLMVPGLALDPARIRAAESSVAA